MRQQRPFRQWLLTLATSTSESLMLIIALISPQIRGIPHIAYSYPQTYYRSLCPFHLLIVGKSNFGQTAQYRPRDNCIYFQCHPALQLHSNSRIAAAGARHRNATLFDLQTFRNAINLYTKQTGIKHWRTFVNKFIEWLYIFLEGTPSYSSTSPVTLASPNQYAACGQFHRKSLDGIWQKKSSPSSYIFLTVCSHGTLKSTI